LRLWDWFQRGKVREEDDRPLRERMRALESDMAQLQLDWETTYGKVRRALATLAKRQLREDAAASDGSSSDSSTQPNGSVDWTDPVVRGRALADAQRRFRRQ